MAHGLEEWLAFTWNQCGPSRTPVPFGKIYQIYETAVDPAERSLTLGSNGEPTDFPNIEVPDAVEAMFSEEHLMDDGKTSAEKKQRDRNVGAAIMFLNRKEEDDDDPLSIGGVNTKAGYLYFHSPSYIEGGSRHRIVINAFPYNKLIRMMRMVVREMKIPGGRLRGVNGAKVMTKACYESGRNDTLIIYMRERDTVDRVLTQIRMWIAEGLWSLRDFGALLPRTVKRIDTGLGYACEPPQKRLLASYNQTLSYGKFLSQIIYIASTIALAAGLKNKNQFTTLATYVLQLAGVHAPEEPYEFSAMSPTFADCMPWDDMAPWSPALEAQIKKTKLYKKVSERTEIAFSYFG